MNSVSVIDRPRLRARVQARTGAWLAGVWQGFVTPSLMSFVTMLVMAALCTAAVCLVVTPRFIAGPLGAYLPRSENDTEAVATRKALRLSSAPAVAGAPARLCMVSNSVLAHSFADEAATAAELKQATGRPWEAVFLTTPLQGPIDEAALADFATRQRPCVMVLGLSFDRFEVTPREALRLDAMVRLGIISPWANGEREDLGGKPRRASGVYAIDNSPFLLREAPSFLARMALGDAAHPRVDAYQPREPLNGHELETRKAVILSGLHRSADNVLAEKLLADLVTHLHERHVPIVFVEEPVSPALFTTPRDRAEYQAYLARSAATARSLGGAYCRPADVVPPPAAAYPDYLHLVDRQTQAAMRRALADCVARAAAAGTVR
jgi:hypothetical protein